MTHRWGTNLHPLEALRVPCADAEMSTFAVDGGIPVRSHAMETTWRRCTSAAAFQRFVLLHGCCYLRKREPSSNDVWKPSQSPSFVLFSR